MVLAADLVNLQMKDGEPVSEWNFNGHHGRRNREVCPSHYLPAFIIFCYKHIIFKICGVLDLVDKSSLFSYQTCCAVIPCTRHPSLIDSLVQNISVTN